MNVLEYFKEISKIPRGSKHEKQISDYLYNFAKDRGYEVVQDKANNIYVYMPATKGYEKYSPLILQGHMDMVWEKNKETVFNFEKDGIITYEEDGYLKAKGTTLGADNGIAVAMMLKLMDDKEIKHPDLELLITTDEEMGMTGASNFDVSLLKGHTMVNLDTEEDDRIYVSSAGGYRTRSYFDVETERVNIGDKIFKLELSGLHGGHSGADIHKNYGNANKLVTEFIRHINLKYETCIVEINGGNKDNAIPREAEIIFTTPDGSIEDITKHLNLIKDILNLGLENGEKLTYKLTELEFNGLEKTYKMTHKETSRIIQFLTHFPNGVRTMSKEIEGLVQTSLNLAVIKSNKENDKFEVSITALLRSSNNQELHDLIKDIEFLTNKFQGKVKVSDGYNAWEYKKDSKVRNLFEKAFLEVTGSPVESAAIHAGLECGLFVEKKNNLDVISIGPNILSPHTPNERLDIKSVDKVFKILLLALEKYDIL